MLRMFQGGAAARMHGLSLDEAVTLERGVVQRLKLYIIGKGVEFTQEPVDQPYGTDVGLRDPFGNHIRITQLASPRA